MNNDYEKKNKEESTESAQNSGGHERRKNRFDGKQNKKQIRMGTGVVLSILAFVILYAIVNLSAISSVLATVISVMTPIIMGFAIAYLLNPILRFCETKIFARIENKKVIRLLSLVSTYTFALAVIGAITFFTVPRVLDEVLANLIPSFDSYIDSTTEYINGLITEYLNSHYIPNIDRNQLLSFVARFFSESGDIIQALGEYAVKYGTGLVIGVKNLVFAFFISIYVLASKERLGAFANKASSAFLSAKTKRSVYKYVKLSDHSFGDFIVRKLLGSLIVSVITFIFLAILDAPFGSTISTIVGVTNIVPIFGPILGGGASFFILFVVDPAKALIFLAFIITVKQIDAHIIRPRIFDTSKDISALSEIIAILIMGEMLGVLGMILAVPVFSVIIAVFGELTEDKLRKKNMPVNTAEYYPENSLIDPYEEHSFGQKISIGMGRIFSDIFGKVTKKGKKGNSTDAPEDSVSEKSEKNADLSAPTEGSEDTSANNKSE